MEITFYNNAKTGIIISCDEQKIILPPKQESKLLHAGNQALCTFAADKHSRADETLGVIGPYYLNVTSVFSVFSEEEQVYIKLDVVSISGDLFENYTYVNPFSPQAVFRVNTVEIADAQTVIQQAYSNKRFAKKAAKKPSKFPYVFVIFSLIAAGIPFSIVTYFIAKNYLSGWLVLIPILLVWGFLLLIILTAESVTSRLFHQPTKGKKLSLAEELERAFQPSHILSMITDESRRKEYE